MEHVQYSARHWNLKQAIGVIELPADSNIGHCIVLSILIIVKHRLQVCLIQVVVVVLQLHKLNLVVDVSVMLDDLDVHRSDLVAVFQQVLGEHVQEGTSRHLLEAILLLLLPSGEVDDRNWDGAGFLFLKMQTINN